MIQLVVLFINGIAVWRLTHLINKESGPWEMFAKFRDRIGIVYDERGQRTSGNELGKMVNCFWCLSISVAVFVELVGADGFYFNRIMAASAIGILIEIVLLKRGISK